VDFSVDFVWEIILQVSVCLFCILDQAWHFFASLFDSSHSVFQDSDLFLKLGKVVVLVFNHRLKLATVNCHLFDLKDTSVKSLCDLSLKVSVLPVVHASRLTH